MQQDPFVILRASKKTIRHSDNQNLRLRKPTTHSWTEKEMRCYLSFLEGHKAIFQDERARKNLKVYSILAKAIQTRTSAQVKSKHQKMMERYNSIHSLIEAITRHLSNNNSRESNCFTGQTDKIQEENRWLAQDEYEAFFESSNMGVLPGFHQEARSMNTIVTTESMQYADGVANEKNKWNPFSDYL